MGIAGMRCDRCGLGVEHGIVASVILPGRRLCERCQLRLLDEILSDLESPAE